jgi:hypothetical protein
MSGRLTGKVRTGRITWRRRLSPAGGLVERDATGAVLSLHKRHYEAIRAVLRPTLTLTTQVRRSGYLFRVPGTPDDKPTFACLSPVPAVLLECDEDGQYRLGREVFSIGVENTHASRKAFSRMAHAMGVDAIQCKRQGDWLVTSLSGHPLDKHDLQRERVAAHAARMDTVAVNLVWYWVRRADVDKVTALVNLCDHVRRTYSVRLGVASGSSQYAPLDQAVRAKRQSERRKVAAQWAGRGVRPFEPFKEPYQGSYHGAKVDGSAQARQERLKAQYKALGE